MIFNNQYSVHTLIALVCMLQSIFITGVAGHTNTSSSTDCDCHKITSWDDLQQLIRDANHSGGDGEDSSLTKQKKIVLCPFWIEKSHDKDTNHWLHFIPIKKPMHIVCQKQSSTDSCTIDITGPTCGKNKNCGRQLLKIKSDNVFIEGLMFRNAKDNIVHVDPDIKNAKLIDFEIYGSYVPESDNASLGGLIVTAKGSSLQILRGKFGWNFASIVYNRGYNMIYDSVFRNNRNRRDGSMGSAIYNRPAGLAMIISSTFDGNVAENGPAIITTVTEAVIDAGMNCASSNSGSTDVARNCDGIYSSESEECIPLSGGPCVISES